MNLPYLRSAATALAATFLCSCASVSVQKMATAKSPTPQKAPSHIVVLPFAVDEAAVRENKYRKNPGQLAADTQKLVAGYIADDLTKAGLPASVGTSSGRRGDAWVVSGRITKLSEGSRILRMGIGLGAGGTKMATSVAVSKTSAKAAFLQFATSGGSNAMPGAATNPIPFSSAPQALLNAKDGISDDAARTARMITGTIVDYAVEHRLIQAPANAPKPKYRAE